MQISDTSDDQTSTPANFDQRIGFLAGHIQRQESSQRLLTEKVEKLTAELEIERANRRRLEQQASELARQIEENSAQIWAIANSGIWRVLVRLGGVALRLLFFLRLSPGRPVQPIQPSLGTEVPPNPGSTSPADWPRESDGDPVTNAQMSPRMGESTEVSPQRTIDEWKTVLRYTNERLPAPSDRGPLFTVITPLFNTKPEWLAEAAFSVLRQTMTDWEWRIIDDGSDRTDFETVLLALRSNPRVKVSRLGGHQGISAALNEGLQTARGEFVCFLDHDDMLEPEALAQCATVLHAGFDAVYTDEDKIAETGELIQPFHKPDWSPEYFRNFMYVGHFLCTRRDLALTAGGFDSSYDGVQDFEFLLRLSERSSRIAHISRILYHWRAVAGSVAADQQAKGDLTALQVRAVQSHLFRMNLPADAQPARSTYVIQITPHRRSSNPKVSIIIAAKDSPPAFDPCLASLSHTTSYRNREVIYVRGPASGPAAAEDLGALIGNHLVNADSLQITTACNSSAHQTDGEYLVFMAPLIEALTPDWIEQMLYYAEQDDIGAVGGLMLAPTGVVKQAGIAISRKPAMRQMYRGQECDSEGWFRSLVCAHEVSAVGRTCLMIRKALFLEVGGFNSSYGSTCYDVDLCLRLLSMGKRNVFTPHARFLNHESESAEPAFQASDRAILEHWWCHTIDRGDQYHRAYANG